MCLNRSGSVSPCARSDGARLIIESEVSRDNGAEKEEAAHQGFK
jgi:hypothetical protein